MKILDYNRKTIYLAARQLAARQRGNALYPLCRQVGGLFALTGVA